MEFIPLDYPTLKLIWWLLLGVLLLGFAIMDGFDLGVASLLPFVARNDEERRVVINTIGPVWEGNQVWLILGGGAIFAAFPPLYAVSFSGFYLAMFVILFALILRPVGFKFRGKVEPKWRNTWDWALFVGGAVPALIFGVAVGNVLLGVPFHFTPELRPVYTGGFFGLLTPFALLAGLVSVAILVAHGAAMLVMKTTGVVAERSARYGAWAALAAAILYALGGVWLALGVRGYRIESVIDQAMPANPLGKEVAAGAGLWMANFSAMPWIWLFPLLGIGGALAAFFMLRARRGGAAFISSALSLTGIIIGVGFTVFPFLLPSSSVPGAGLTLWDASSSHMTLWVMLLATLIFLPIVLAYTAWVFRVLRGKVTPESVDDTPNAY
ncbi:cytochrome d ubiquinol oxidase subunit II [Luteimonas sp. e5]